MSRQLTCARWRVRWIRCGPLARDLGVVLVVKFAALGLLWWAFFSHPEARHAALDAAGVEAQLVPSATPERFPHAER